MRDIENEEVNDGPENPIVKGDWLVMVYKGVIESFGKAYRQDDGGDWETEGEFALSYFKGRNYETFRCPKGDWSGIINFYETDLIDRPLIPMNLTECHHFCEKVEE